MRISSFTFRVKESVLDDFQRSTADNNRPASQVVRDFMIKYLEESGVSWVDKNLLRFKDKASEDLSHKFSIRISKTLLDDFKEKALLNQHVPSKIIRMCIYHYIAKNKK